MEQATTETIIGAASTEEPSGDNGDSGIFWAGLGSILGFYVLVLLVGALASLYKKSYKGTSDDMMLARRDIGIFVGIFSMTATWVGGGFLNGTAEYIANPEFGLAWCMGPFAFSMSFVVGGILFAKKMRRGEYTTVVDPYQVKYGSVMTSFLCIPEFFGDIFWSAAILMALGSSLTVVVGLKQDYAIIISGAVAIVYTLIGGLYSVSFTDVIQLICMFGGLVLVLPFAMANDSVSAIKDTARGDGGWLGHLAGDRNVGLWIDGTLLPMLGGIGAQVYHQRLLSQKTPQRALIVSLAAGFGCLVMSVPPILIGAVAASTDWNSTDYPQGIKGNYALALPLVLRYLTPTAVSVIGLGAVSAAVMSSADSSCLAAASVFARNIYSPLRRTIASAMPCAKCRSNTNVSESEVIWVLRIGVVITGCLACGLAIGLTSVYELNIMSADLSFVITFPQFFCVMYFDFANTYGAVAGYVLGLFFRLAGGEAMVGWKPLIKYPYYDEETGIQYFPYKTLAMLIDFVTIILVSLLTRLLFKRGFLPAKADIFGCFKERSAEEKVPEKADHFQMQNQINT